MKAREWINRIEFLVWRFAHHAIGPDVTGMAATDLAALYAYVVRMAATR